MSYSYATRKQARAPETPRHTPASSHEALENALQARMAASGPTVEQRRALSMQNSAAEREADRLSSGIRSGSPDMVKARLGSRLGADFSAVRFHTGSAAAAKADRMGARAYTSGGDVYFGSGGFDSGVAAHELVHTVQQGATGSVAATMSTPVGTAQMSPSVGNKIWDKTGGGLKRKTHEAEEELFLAKQSGDWDKLTKFQKMSWKVNNPFAYKRMKNKKYQDKAQARIAQHQTDKETASKFLNELKESGDAPLTSMLGDPTEAKVEAESGQGGLGQMLLEKLGLGDVMESAGDMKDSSAAGEDLDALLAALETTAGFTDWISDIRENGGDKLESLSNFINTALKVTGDSPLKNALESMGGIVGNASDVVEAIGESSVFTGFDALSAGAQMVQGGKQLYRGVKQKKGAKAIEEKLGKREGLKGQDLINHDIAAQAAMEGTRQAINGGTNAAVGTMNAAAIAGGPAGEALKVAAKVVSKGGEMAAEHQHGRMVEKVTEQATGVNDAMIEKFRVYAGFPDTEEGRRRAKRGLLRAYGYETGYREELFSHQTEERGKYLANAATEGNETAVDLAKAMSMHTNKKGEYSADTAAKRLGQERSQQDVLRDTYSVRAMVAQNEQNAAQKKAKEQQKAAKKAAKEQKKQKKA